MSDDPTPDISAILAEWADVPGGLLPALHAVQHQLGFVDRRLIPELAKAFYLSVAEVHGVITFYKDFRISPVDGPHVQVCRAEACQARGGRAVWEAASTLAGCHVDDVMCLGLCAQGPAVAVDGRMHSNVSPATLSAVVAGTARPAGRSEVAPAAHTVSAPVTVYVPGDAAAVALGADDVAAVLAAQPGVIVIRNGSRGMLWLEPLVEVDNGSGRTGFGPVTADSARGVLDGTHPGTLGDVTTLPWMAAQQRITFARVGAVDPRSLTDYEAHGGLAGLRRALSMTADEILFEVTSSGLRGRGGAAFPTGVKWRTVADAAGPQKYIVCNADEGDSGTFADRMLIEGDPFVLIEGMIIAGLAVGATEGYVYLRSEYPHAAVSLRAAIALAEDAGLLTAAGSGTGVLGSGHPFHLHLRIGAGAYICGEETSLLNSLEGRRGEVRAKPPLPAVEGLFARPTVVNNVLSLATVPELLAHGGASYWNLGSGRSRGTQVFQLGGNIARGGVVEAPFGITLRDLVEGLGGGTASGRPVRAVQVGGPLGAYVPADQLDLPLDYEAFAAAGAMVGHGGIVVFDDTVDMVAQARFAMEFCAAESCGKCTPCRIGSTRGVELLDAIAAGRDVDANLAVLDDLCEVMADGSLCAMGGLTPMPVRSALTHFAADFHDRAQGAPA